jgi:transcriptional regulator with XRE-family HTH domain
MSIQAQVAIHAKKLGVLIRDARLAAGRTVTECARLAGVTNGIFRAWEEGRKAPSLPELEVLAYFLRLPLSHFWGQEAVSDDVQPTEAANFPALVDIRQRLLGALLRQQREKAGFTAPAFARQAGIPTARLRAYEQGERPIPLPELEGLVALLGGQIEAMFDQSGPIGEWIAQQKAIQDFLQLSPELQAFVSKPVNRPYLGLAMKLSALSTDKLRSVAEDLLQITL